MASAWLAGQHAGRCREHKNYRYLVVDGVVDTSVVAVVLVGGRDAEQHRSLGVILLDARLVDVGVERRRMIVVVRHLRRIIRAQFAICKLL